MTNTLLRAGAMSCALLATTCLTAPAVAQALDPSPRFSNVDANGVDLVTGEMTFSLDEGTIGSGEGAVTLTRRWFGSPFWGYNWTGTTYTIGALTYVELNGISDTFTLSGSTYIPTKANGATLAQTADPNIYRYTASDGTIIDFRRRDAANSYPIQSTCPGTAVLGTCGIPITLIRPNGMRFDIGWDIVPRCAGPGSCPPAQGGATARFRSVTSSAGYSVTVNYATNDPGPSPGIASAWFQTTGAAFANSVSSCGTSCPSVTYSPSGDFGTTTVTDALGRAWRLDVPTLDLTGIRRPGSASDNVTISYNPVTRIVTSVTRDGVTTNYARSVAGSTATTTVTRVDSDPGAPDPQWVYIADLNLGRITRVTNPVSLQTNYAYDANARLTRFTQPEGNYTEHSYDARGNVTQTLMRAKSGSGVPDMVTSASYSASCTNILTCNQPVSTTDARGFTTDYTYNATHGGVLTMTPQAPTGPAPSGTGTRPQTRYSYTLTSSPVSGHPGAYLLTGISACQTTASCTGAADEAKTTIGYGSNMLATSSSSGSGNGSLTATTAAAYDPVGNLLTVDGPLSGTADTTRFRYDLGRQRIGVISPDPDGGGALKHRAQRITYNPAGQATKVETGTVNSQSDPDWAAFATLEEVQQDYDVNARPTVQRLVSGATTYALAQISYDGLGRVRCQARRMNPAEFGSLPATACTLDTQGSYGPDRITRTSYDLVSRPNLVETGYGVAGTVANEVATTYTNNGLAYTVTDANSNRTTYNHDGLDRLTITQMPSPTTPNTSSSTDLEVVYFETLAGGTRSGPLPYARMNRGGEFTWLYYDNLGRLTTKDLPSSEPDVTYTYDLFNRMTGTSQTGNSLSFTFDALGRNLTQAGPQGTMSYQYDLAGRRTRTTYADVGLYVEYDYLLTNEITKIRENGATTGIGVLGTYAYDDRGRRTSLTRGNGTVTSYTYDNVDRLTQLAQDLTGTTNDLTLGFTLNPASQIISNTRSNDAYSFAAYANQSVTHTINGLNQVMTGPSTWTYDARGNISAIGTSTYGYSSENLMTSAVGGVTLGYDPMMRLYQTVGSGTTTRFGYDGLSMVAEYNGANTLQRRYVHGPGVDEPLAWYEGTGTTTRRWFHADERGSVIAVSDASGNPVSFLNRYEEYGASAGTVTGRFGYTGQAWIPETGFWYYRARIYNPYFGRFMQTDPIGYGSGMNLYAYVGNDPVNFTDPTGLQLTCEGGPNCENGGGLVTGRRPPPPALPPPPLPLPPPPNREPLPPGPDAGSRNPVLPLSLRPPTRRYLCRKLREHNFNAPLAYRSILDDRHVIGPSGRNNWSVRESREAENWLYSSGLWRYPPTDGSNRIDIYLHSYLKYFVSGTSEFSQDALDAGLEGSEHNNDTRADLERFCNAR